MNFITFLSHFRDKFQGFYTLDPGSAACGLRGSLDITHWFWLKITKKQLMFLKINTKNAGFIGFCVFYKITAGNLHNRMKLKLQVVYCSLFFLS